jgi:putative tryptophan/tyrosine transport system substrate-binding protein
MHEAVVSGRISQGTVHEATRFHQGGCSAAIAWPFAVSAQQAPVPVVGFLDSRSTEAIGNRLRGFRQGLGDEGYVEGRNVTIEYRWAENRLDRLPELAGDLVSRHVRVLIASGGQPVNFAAKDATTTIPIIFLTPQDPVKVGLVISLARPSGNLTGVNFFNGELAAKQFELLREMLPNARRIAALIDPAAQSTTETTLQDLETAARATGMQLYVLKATNSRDIDVTFEAMAREHVDGVFVEQSPFLNSRRIQLVQLAARYTIPATYSGREYTEVGGLISYGSDIADAYRQVGVYCGHILKGAKVSELPVVQSSKLEIVINAQTARMLGLTISPQMLARADEVIE